jgi:hypothetical protein
MSGPYLRTNKEIFYTTINILSHFTKKNENILPYTNYNCFLQFFIFVKGCRRVGHHHLMIGLCLTQMEQEIASIDMVAVAL